MGMFSSKPRIRGGKDNFLPNPADKWAQIFKEGVSVVLEDIASRRAARAARPKPIGSVNINIDPTQFPLVVEFELEHKIDPEHWQEGWHDPIREIKSVGRVEYIEETGIVVIGLLAYHKHVRDAKQAAKIAAELTLLKIRSLTVKSDKQG